MPKNYLSLVSSFNRVFSRVLLLTLVSGSLAFVSISPAAAAPGPCLPITGSGQEVLNNGVANSGVLDFGSVSAPYQPCISDNAA